MKVGIFNSFRNEAKGSVDKLPFTDTALISGYLSFEGGVGCYFSEDDVQGKFNISKETSLK